MLDDPNLPPSELEPGAIPDAPETVRKQAADLRSRALVRAGRSALVRASFAGDADGLRAGGWTGKPVIAIINTWSDLQPCHSHFKQRVDDVKRGILMAGGFPVELPALSVAESFVKPTTMMYRNMLAMETEELLRSHPVDGAVLMGGCDKTTPALLLGATSMNIPAVFVPAGPMLRGNWQGECSARARIAGNTGRAARGQDHGPGLARGSKAVSPARYGTCMTMGTASTMTAIAEAIGMVLPGGSSIPAADAGHIRLCSKSGRRIVEMVWEDLTPRKIRPAPRSRTESRSRWRWAARPTRSST